MLSGSDEAVGASMALQTFVKHAAIIGVCVAGAIALGAGVHLARVALGF
jgi:hypothetical protein